ncbi:hypothetical protein MPF19_18745 [Polaribacter sp. Z014]|uniref:hypothetical protein n=1 Tax=Polaribacter sp. Z014 TaxID=2927126 RepID=UPI00201FEAB4|nr:hypothetical protein [Polaribacter sp. Z014]MCL7765461.1 hypothetical protein [Polaribacter sp. Z014]
MNKLILISLLAITFLSCDNKSKIEKLKNQIITLKKQNDSLGKITKWVENKYIFDSISFRQIPDYKNTHKINSVFREEFVFVGINFNRKSSVIVGDSISYKNGLKVINGTILEMKNGGFLNEIILKKKRNFYSGIIKSKNDFGKKFEATIRSGILTKKN